MNKHKLILSIFLFLLAGFLHAQERNFEKEIQETEKQIQSFKRRLKAIIKKFISFNHKKKVLANNYLLQKKVFKIQNI